MLIIRVVVSQATASVSIQDPDRNIRRPVKLLTENDIQGQLVGERGTKEAGGRLKMSGPAISDKERKV